MLLKNVENYFQRVWRESAINKLAILLKNLKLKFNIGLQKNLNTQGLQTEIKWWEC